MSFPAFFKGPLINTKQFDRVVTLVNEAKSKGAQTVLGGDRHVAGELHYQPTILTNVKPDMELFKEEIFGPVISVIKFNTEEVGLARPSFLATHASRVSLSPEGGARNGQRLAGWAGGVLLLQRYQVRNYI